MEATVPEEPEARQLSMFSKIRSNLAAATALLRLPSQVSTLAQTVQETRNDINRIEMMLWHHKRIGDALDEIRNDLAVMRTDDLPEIRIRAKRAHEAAMQARLLHNAGLRARLEMVAKAGRGRTLPAPTPYTFDDKLGELARAFPRAYPIWIEAFERGRREYEAAPALNLAVEGHTVADHFRGYLAPFMSGSVLDIGCGPQVLPSYLRGFPDAAVAGLDPLSGAERRDFQFVRGLAEFLPWPDDSFDVTLFATSLDHVLSLDWALDEVCRVLRPGGFCIVWAGLIEGAKPYDPLAEDVAALDDYHLFHFSDETLRETFKSRFELLENTLFIENNAFYTFVRRS
ncbi:methyltransferase domain-containing protein [Bosea thiooxidans]